jgi:hypothetical protein
MRAHELKFLRRREAEEVAESLRAQPRAAAEAHRRMAQFYRERADLLEIAAA